MHIRKMEKSDAEIYWACRLQALKDYPMYFASTYEEAARKSMEEVQERINPDHEHYILGAFHSNKKELLGMVGFRRRIGEKLRHKSSIWGMYVTPQAQGNGIGKKLIHEVVRHARTLEGLEQIQLYVVTTNQPAKRLYRSFGFETFGVEKRALIVNGQAYDEELMALDLREARSPSESYDILISQ